MYLWRKSASCRWFRTHEVRLQIRADGRLAVVEQSGRKRLQLEICCDEGKQARRLVKEFGGQIQQLPRDWLKRFSREQMSRPIRIGKRLVILHSNVGGTSVSRRFREKREARSFPYSLVIPTGAAFGTGYHATTAMSLRLLEEVSRKLKSDWSMVDLGTGSGILALAAKCFGAKRAIGIDNDARAIATARENARLNEIATVSFRVADVRKWKLPRRIDILTANLFSELLIEILPRLQAAHCLILSGILRAQERDVRRGLRLNKIGIVTVRRRGKWIALLANCSGRRHLS